MSPASPPIRYLSLSELLYINGVVLADRDLLAGRKQIRDVALLEAAIARPAISAFGADAYPTLREKAAALFHSVARNHAFTDGNKRTATVAAIFMLAVNGQQVVWQAEEALHVIMDAAEGRLTFEQLAAWWPLQACAPMPQPNAVQDMQSIAQIVSTHHGLLDELASR